MIPWGWKAANPTRFETDARPLTSETRKGLLNCERNLTERQQISSFHDCVTSAAARSFPETRLVRGKRAGASAEVASLPPFFQSVRGLVLLGSVFFSALHQNEIRARVSFSAWLQWDVCFPSARKSCPVWIDDLKKVFVLICGIPDAVFGLLKVGRATGRPCPRINTRERTRALDGFRVYMCGIRLKWKVFLLLLLLPLLLSLAASSAPKTYHLASEGLFGINQNGITDPPNFAPRSLLFINPQQGRLSDCSTQN